MVRCMNLQAFQYRWYGFAPQALADFHEALSNCIPAVVAHAAAFTSVTGRHA